ncbi:MAG: hypothetical protein EOM15_02970 [Spirochaetia bacterium]|nr:hypothetical protein [Spirochaetia bacterium]
MAKRKATVHYGSELNLTPKIKLSKSAQEFSSALEWFTQEELSDIQECLMGSRVTKGRKGDQCDQIAKLVDFPNQETFNTFFSQLPSYLQKLIQAGCLDRYIDIRSQDWGLEEPLILIDEKNSYYYYYNRGLELNPKYRLGLFKIHNKNVLHFNEAFGQYFLPYLYPEKDYIPQPAQNTFNDTWSVEHQIQEVFPLFVESLLTLLKDRDSITIMKKGLLKGNLKDLRAMCGLAPFPLSASYNLDPLVLLAKFVLSFETGKLNRPEDGMALIKTLVQRMFFETRPRVNLPYGSQFEYFALLDQCSLNSGYSYSVALDEAARKGVVTVLSALQMGEGWYSVEDLFKSFLVRGFSMRFHNQEVLHSVLYIRGQEIQLPYAQYTTYDDKGFHPSGVLKRILFERPLFFAYLYLLASLGILDIAEKTPELLLTKNDKQFPLTPYEALGSVRLTSFGAWCLNMVDERPQQKEQVFETITDTELLLVTFKGKSLERRLFLDQIGIPLGVERYRITEASFIKGCASSAEILKRIEKFKLIIDPEPSARWLQFFDSIQKRSLLFTKGEQVLLYSFPDDPEIRSMFSTNPAFKKLVIRAEGNNVIVKKGNQKAFQRLLMEHGYLNTL